MKKFTLILTLIGLALIVSLVLIFSGISTLTDIQNINAMRPGFSEFPASLYAVGIERLADIDLQGLSGN